MPCCVLLNSRRYLPRRSRCSGTRFKICVGEFLEAESQSRTVKELRDKPAQFDDGMNVIVYWENGNEQNLFDKENLNPQWNSEESWR